MYAAAYQATKPQPDAASDRVPARDRSASIGPGRRYGTMGHLTPRLECRGRSAAREQVPRTERSCRRRRTTSADRAPRSRVTSCGDAGVRAGRVRQDDHTRELARRRSRRMRPPVAWVSLDHGTTTRRRSGPTSSPRCGPSRPRRWAAQRSALLQSPQPVVRGAWSRPCSTTSSRLPADLLLVLDDYHLIEASEIHDGLAFLLDHQPPQLHLVIASRADPPLALAGLRAQRPAARDPRGRPALHGRGVRGLPQRPDGAGADRAATSPPSTAAPRAGSPRCSSPALSMQGRDDASAFIAGFAGDDRYIVDYLAEEVLARQTRRGAGLPARDLRPRPAQRPAVRRGDRAPRRAGHAGGAGAGQPVPGAARRPPPVVALPPPVRRRPAGPPGWRSGPTAAPELHRRASVWFERDGDTAAAVQHAMAARDLDRAADLMELAIPELSRDRREAEFHGWVLALPDEVVAVRPVLGVALAGALAQVSAVRHASAERLDVVERSLRAGPADPWPEQPPPGLIVVDREGFRATARHASRPTARPWPSRAATSRARSHHAQSSAGPRRARRLPLAAAAGALGGLAAWTVGDLDGGPRGVHGDGHRTASRPAFVADVLGCSITLADIRLTQGRLGDAVRHLPARPRPRAPPRRERRRCEERPTCTSAIAGALLERDDRAGAAEHLAASQRLGDDQRAAAEPLPLAGRQGPAPRGRGRPRRRARAARRGRPGLRRRLLPERPARSPRCAPGCRCAAASSAALVPGHASAASPPTTTVVPARVRARDPGPAPPGPARERDPSSNPNGCRLREVDLAARAAAGRGRGRRARRHGHRAPRPAVARPPPATAICPPPWRRCSASIALAEPEGYVRVFADEGRPLAGLLDALTKQGGGTDYVRRLRAASIGPATPQARRRRALVAPLSDRELDVLRLLGVRPERPRDRPRALGVPQHAADAHQEHLRQARRQQPPGGGPSGRPELDLLPAYITGRSPHVVMSAHQVGS